MSADTPVKTPTKLMTVKECAEYLQCSKITVYRLVEEGRLPAVMVGRLMRFDPQALHDWTRNPKGGGRNVSSKRG